MNNDFSLFDGVVLRSEHLKCSGQMRTGPIYVVTFECSPNYLCHIGVTIFSILKYNRDLNLRFNLFTDGIEKEDKEKFQQLVDTYSCQVSIYYMNNDAFVEMLHSDGSAVWFYRFLFAPTLAAAGAKRLLSVDGDILCCGSLRPLLEMDMKGKILAGVRDTSETVENRRKKLVGTKQYFNAGMIMIDVEAWNQAGISQKAWNMAIERKKSGMPLHSHDQDILNILLNNDVMMLDPKYNYIYNLDMQPLLKKQEPLVWDPEAVFVHYAGIVKPWRSWVQELPGVKAYREVWLDSPWKDVPLTGFQRHKDIHQAARNARRCGHYGESLKLYLRYLMKKF